MIKCPLCGLEFSEKDAKKACESCKLFKGCTLIKCPNCNYEMPVEYKDKKGKNNDFNR